MEKQKLTNQGIIIEGLIKEFGGGVDSLEWLEGVAKLVHSESEFKNLAYKLVRSTGLKYSEVASELIVLIQEGTKLLEGICQIAIMIAKKSGYSTTKSLKIMLRMFKDGLYHQIAPSDFFGEERYKEIKPIKVIPKSIRDIYDFKEIQKLV